jgi:hypothetical protein
MCVRTPLARRRCGDIAAEGWKAGLTGGGGGYGRQITMMMDMFSSQFSPRLDFVGQMSHLREDQADLMATFMRSQHGSTAEVQQFVTFVSNKHSALQADKRRLKPSYSYTQETKENYYASIPADLLCRVAERLRFDYECLSPLYDISRWCPSA